MQQYLKIFICILALPGRVKTVTELEAGLRHQVTRNAAINSLLPLNSPQEKDEGDLTAFNKLLCLMTAGASGQESPKQVYCSCH